MYGNEEVDEDDAKDDKYNLLIETMTRVKAQLGTQQVALNHLVMKVNNLIERKSKREAIRKGTYKAPMATSHMSHFTQRSKATKVSEVMKQSKFSRNTAAQKESTNKAKDNVKIASLFNKDSSDDDLDIDEKERIQKKELEEIDMKYLIGDDQLEDDVLVSKAANKNKQKVQDDLKPLVSPFIPPRSGQTT